MLLEFLLQRLEVDLLVGGGKVPTEVDSLLDWCDPLQRFRLREAGGQVGHPLLYPFSRALPPTLRAGLLEGLEVGTDGTTGLPALGQGSLVLLARGSLGGSLLRWRLWLLPPSPVGDAMQRSRDHSGCQPSQSGHATPQSRTGASARPRSSPGFRRNVPVDFGCTNGCTWSGPARITCRSTRADLHIYVARSEGFEPPAF